MQSNECVFVDLCLNNARFGLTLCNIIKAEAASVSAPPNVFIDTNVYRRLYNNGVLFWQQKARLVAYNIQENSKMLKEPSAPMSATAVCK